VTYSEAITALIGSKYRCSCRGMWKLFGSILFYFYSLYICAISAIGNSVVGMFLLDLVSDFSSSN
jgi:hypothetical protein